MKVVDILLKNISQVVLLSNKWTGLFILIGLFIADWSVGLAAIMGSLIAYLLAHHVNYTDEEINEGLVGFNPVLTAVALTIFLNESGLNILITVMATVLTLPVGSAVREFLKPYQIPMLTIPFVIVTWFAVMLPGQVKLVDTPLKLIPNKIEPTHFNQNYEHIHLFQSLLEGFSQVFIETSVLGGLFILIGIVIASRKAALLAIGANLAGFLIVALLGGNYDDINHGLFGYNFTLMAIALGYTFKTVINPYVATIFGTMLTVIVQLGLNTLLEPFGIPSLTMPFIIATWILLFAGIKNREHNHVRFQRDKNDSSQ
ncbi:urea transporter [Staphylococcus simiae]|uniref:urea transporter n=1 Tax=Staphylococcus simiae TaxID=308354 RepID=UPI001A97373F|nr:urea transporter [Staphylococcus simiae]MBO1198120.1 urea transporter [Staphylococcus simiae]MBO1200130.1 urea transporter [Staphylococcus simiae]MBO1202403.1 urea transporter [Staphylococcus simiae]MBO1210015.1 urea transporter [Staphylococcus simiae]MBO1228547.1 urea transporter [Staphylococcus simiae]